MSAFGGSFGLMLDHSFCQQSETVIARIRMPFGTIDWRSSRGNVLCTKGMVPIDPPRVFLQIKLKDKIDVLIPKL